MNIFIVEDSPVIRRVMVRRLGDIPEIRVVGEAEGEVDALCGIDQLRPDTVLLDISLARAGSGLQVLKQLRQDGYPGRIIMVSTQEGCSDACIQAGADGFYDKASGLETLFDDLACVAADRPALNPRPGSPTHRRVKLLS